MAASAVSPGLTAGGGLKPRTLQRRRQPHVSPGLTAGGGLKRRYGAGRPMGVAGLPRPHRRGRIETDRVAIVDDAADFPASPPASPPGAD